MYHTIMAYSTYETLLYGWMAIAVIVFFVLLRIPAPYGRHVTAGWGPQINNRLGWILMELPVLLVLCYFIFSSIERQTPVTWVLVGLFSFHYINRIFIFPLRLHTKGKSIPLVIVGSAIGFNLVNGFALGYYFKYFAQYPATWFTDFRFILGLLLFIAGLLINWKADDILIHLRKPNETHYVIPRTGWFTYISCPNHFGEIIEWSGYAILCWNLPAAAFLLWTIANLVPRAFSHHRWYKEKFEDYPVERKAIIPFVI